MRFSTIVTRRSVLATAAGMAALLCAFAYGLAVARLHVFPYGPVTSAYRALFSTLSRSAVGLGNDLIRTNLVTLRTTSVNYWNSFDLAGNGGGITSLGNSILGVDSDGRFFLYAKSGAFQRLEISIPTNEDLLTRYVRERVRAPNDRDHILRHFRVLDITTREAGEKTEVFVSHNYWDPTQLSRTIRLSRVTVDSMPDLVAGRSSIQADQWETIYETQPSVPFSPDPLSPFGTNRSGGRLAFNRDGDLIVGFGDQEFDGVGLADKVSQDDSSSYGKALTIDLRTLESRVIAKGIRNPLGLLLDRAGNVWETEHGPEGGDELNLLHMGENYGWPLMTYGTAYDRHEWPLSEAQGSHRGFTRPVFAWVPSIGVSNLIQVGETPQVWQGDLLVSSLMAMRLYRLRVREGRVILAEPIEIGERIRDLEQMRDGTILLWADNARFVELAVVDPSLVE